MGKSWLESSKDLVVGPGLQRRNLFPEEHQAAVSLSILAEVASLIPGDCVNMILQRYSLGEKHF